MEEYKEAKEMMLDIGRQILLKVYELTKTTTKTKTETNAQHGKADSVEGPDDSESLIPFNKAKNTRWSGEPQIAPEVIFEVILYNIC